MPVEPRNASKNFMLLASQISNDHTFRWVLLAGMVLFVPAGLYFRFKSHTGEKLDRRQEGWFILISLRLVALAAAIGLITYLVNPEKMSWSSIPLPVPLRWPGAAFMFLAGCLVIWTFYNLGANLTDTVVTREKHTLVTSGPYRWVRHPFYMAGVLALLGIFLLTANVYILVSGLLALSLLVLRTRKEEEKLIERFGEEYRNYMQRTGRFIPKLQMRR